MSRVLPLLQLYLMVEALSALQSALHVIVLHDALCQRFQLKSKHARIISRQAQITPHEPETLMSRASPHGPKLALFVESPDIFDSLGRFVAEYLSASLTEMARAN